MKKLNLLISTINDRVLGLKNIIVNHPNIVFTVSHQVTEKLGKESSAYIQELENKDNIIYSQITSVGVAKNRNNALKHRVRGSICLLCDDDVVYFEDAFDKVLNAFEGDRTLEFLTFKIKTFSGRDYKNYKDHPFKQNIKTLTNIGIIDVAFREEVLDQYNLLFDERFGPGGEYPIGEDFIFMTDAYKKGAKIYYQPIDIVQHGDVGTGWVLEDKIIFGRGAVFARVFGSFSFFINVYFSLKNRVSYKNKYTLYRYLKLMSWGSYDFYRSEKKRNRYA
jgi:hypothetical protein